MTKAATPDAQLVTPESRDHIGGTRLWVVLVPCPFPDCTMTFSGATHSSARRAIDGHLEYSHPGTPPTECAAVERRRTADA